MVSGTVGDHTDRPIRQRPGYEQGHTLRVHYYTSTSTLYTRWRKKRREYLHALFSRAVEMNQCQSIYVTIKHLQICVGIFD